MSMDEKTYNFRTWVMTAIVVAVVVLAMVYNRQLAQPLSQVESGQDPMGQTLGRGSQPPPAGNREPNPTAPESPPVSYQDGTVTLVGQVLNIQLAEDLPTQLAGLSNRPSMAENEGMLFVLAKTQTPEFWMKDMLFPLDIIWIRDGRVADIDSRLGIEPGKTDNDLKRYLPKEAVNMVLEINAGWAETNHLSIGDEVKINLAR